MMEALQYSHLDNPWGYAFWDEFNQKTFFETADGVALGALRLAEPAAPGPGKLTRVAEV